MARELVQTHAAALDGKKDLFREEKTSVGKCPRCGSPVHEGKKNYYCSNKECAFVMWKNDRFFEERKTAFSAKIAAALLKSGNSATVVPAVADTRARTRPVFITGRIRRCMTFLDARNI